MHLSINTLSGHFISAHLLFRNDLNLATGSTAWQNHPQRKQYIHKMLLLILSISEVHVWDAIAVFSTSNIVISY